MLLDVGAHLRESPLVLGDRSGGALAAWVTFPGDRPGVSYDPGASSLLQVVRRTPGGEFGPVTTPTAAGRHVRGLVGAGDGQGRAVFAWRNGAKPAGGLHLALASTATGVAAPQALSDVGALPPAPAQLGGDPVSQPAVALSPRGDALVVWLARARAGCGYEVRAAVRRPGSPRFLPGSRVSAACGQASFPRVALNAAGVGAIAWSAGPSGARPHTIMVARATRGSISAPTVLTRAAAPFAPALSADGNGAVLAWRAYGGLVRRGLKVIRGRVMATSADERGALRRPRAISKTDRTFGTPRVAVGRDQSLAVAWQTGNAIRGLGPVELVERRPGAGAFSAPESLAGGGGNPASLHVALDAHGAVAVLHCGTPTGGIGVLLNIRTATGTLATPELPGGDRIVAQYPCGGPVQPAADLAISGEGATLVVLPQLTRLAIVERQGPLG